MYVVDSIGENTYDLSKASSIKLVALSTLRNYFHDRKFAIELYFGETNTPNRILNFADEHFAKKVFQDINDGLANGTELYDISAEMKSKNKS